MAARVATTQSYSFSASPRAVDGGRQKYREPVPPPREPQNIMYDRRVMRGSTIARALAANNTINEEPKSPPRNVQKPKAPLSRPPLTPEPVPGRKHMDIQTDIYLEEITDRPKEADVEVQTDPFLERPPTPKFVPPKTGVDAESQIYPGDLFDFDVEVEPILEILVGQILEQSMMEVLEEEEIANLKRHQLEFEQKRNAELVEAQRLEEQERRREEEKERRVKEERERIERENKLKEKVAARAFAQSYLSNLEETVFGKLKSKGYFYDSTLREVETQFMPWLYSQVDYQLSRVALARTLVGRLIEDTLKRAARQHVEIQLKLQQEKEELQKEEQRRLSEMQTTQKTGSNSNSTNENENENDDDEQEDEDGEEEDEDEDEDEDDDDGKSYSVPTYKVANSVYPPKVSTQQYPQQRVGATLAPSMPVRR